MDVWYDGSHAVSFYEYGGDDNPLKRYIGNTWRSWGLVPTNRPFFVPPKRKTEEVSIPGTSGSVNVSNFLTGYPTYENRDGSWQFLVTDYGVTEEILDNNSNIIRDSSPGEGEPILATIMTDFSEKYTQLLNMLHGIDVAIVLDEDPTYFYRGSIEVGEWTSTNDGSFNGMTITYKVYPYKLKREFTEVVVYPNTDAVSLPLGRMPTSFKLGLASDPGTIVDSRSGNIIFNNDELAIKIVNNRSFSFTDVLSYSNVDTGATAQPFILTNVNGHNTCTFKINIVDTNINRILLRYRIGEL